jgi:hypothetical protein
MIFLITYWWIAVSLDWSSTIEAHDYKVEENPFMKNIWQQYGDNGFTLASLLFGVVGTLVLLLASRYSYKKITFSFAFLIITFKILIALTNLVVIPLWVTGWFNF